MSILTIKETSDDVDIYSLFSQIIIGWYAYHLISKLKRFQWRQNVYLTNRKLQKLRKERNIREKENTAIAEAKQIHQEHEELK